MIETANANGVEPYAYLALVLTGMQYLGAKREDRASICRCKRKHAMRYTPYRGLTAVRNWVGLKFTAMNLKKFAIHKDMERKRKEDSLNFIFCFLKLLQFNIQKSKLEIQLTRISSFFDRIIPP